MGEEALRESKKSGTPRVPSSQRRTLAALKDELLSPKQVALISGVSYKTVQRAVDAKQLSCIKTKGGHRRIPVEVAEQWVRSLLNKANNRLNGL